MKTHGGYDTANKLVAARRLVNRSKRWTKYNRPGAYDLGSSPEVARRAKSLLRKHNMDWEN